MDGTGDIICGLDELLLVAAERWRTPLTQQDVARMSGLSRSTINELLPRRVQERALGGAAAETDWSRSRAALHCAPSPRSVACSSACPGSCCATVRRARRCRG